MPDFEHVCWSRGLAYTADVAARRDTMDVFMSMVGGCKLDLYVSDGVGPRPDLVVYICIP